MSDAMMHALAKTEDAVNESMRGTGKRVCYHIDRTVTYHHGVVAGSTNEGFYHSTCDYCPAWGMDYYRTNPSMLPQVYKAEDW